MVRAVYVALGSLTASFASRAMPIPPMDTLVKYESPIMVRDVAVLQSCTRPSYVNSTEIGNEGLCAKNASPIVLECFVPL